MDPLSNHQHNLGRWFRPPDPAGSCRKDAGKSPHPSGKHRESLEHGSSIPARNFSDFFPVDPCQVLVLSGRNQAESIGKNSKIFPPEYCVHKITGIGRFRAGLFDLRMMKTDIDECHDRYLDKEKRKRGVKHDWPFFIATLIILVNSLWINSVCLGS